MKKVSVIIPAYNVEKYINETIQSVLAQTHPNFEILVIDDGSFDRTAEVCQHFNDPRIKVVKQKNSGVSAARNAGIRLAQGEYIAFLDADDLWTVDKLEKHIQHLESSPQVGVSFCRSAFIDEHGKPLGIYQMPKLENITPELILCRNPIGNGSVPVMRREVFEDLIRNDEDCHYFDVQLQNCEDVECWVRIALKTEWKLEGIPDALTLYRVHSKGSSASLQKHLNGFEAMLEKLEQFDSVFADQHGDRAKAYQLRYLARRAVTLELHQAAVQLFNQAIVTYWQIVLEEPRRTLLTGLAVYLMQILPKSLYLQLQAIAVKMTGATQKRQIQQDQSEQVI